MSSTATENPSTNSSSSATWTPPTGTLGRLMTAAAERSRLVESTLGQLKAQGKAMAPPPAFASALRRDTLAVIAEIKRSSPTKGDIAPGLNAADQARAYTKGGAAAISVLTEPEKFGGSLDDLSSVAQAVSIPVLRKDFIVHAVQIWEARVCGAAAVLLIARGLHPEQLAALYAEAVEASLGVLVEVRDEVELARAIALGAPVIGVNNRNLETLVIDPTTAPSLMASIPADRIAIAESGMAQVSDALPAQVAGADALLIGSAISASADPAAAVQAFASLRRVPRNV